MIKLDDIRIVLNVCQGSGSESVRDLAERTSVILEMAWAAATRGDELPHDQAGRLAEALDGAAYAIRTALCTALYQANASPVPTRTPASERDTVIPPPPVPVKKRAKRPLPGGVVDLASRRRRGK